MPSFLSSLKKELYSAAMLTSGAPSVIGPAGVPADELEAYKKRKAAEAAAAAEAAGRPPPPQHNENEAHKARQQQHDAQQDAALDTTTHTEPLVARGSLPPVNPVTTSRHWWQKKQSVSVSCMS